MRKYVPGLTIFGACVLVGIICALAILAAGSIARQLDPLADESHLLRFMVAIIGVAVATGAAFPIFSRGVPRIASLLKRVTDLDLTSPRQS